MAGYPRSQHRLAPAHLERLSGRRVGDLAALEFSDGCHALLVELGEGDPEPLEAEFARLDAARSRVIRALRAHLALNGVALKTPTSGHWTFQAGAAQGFLQVGSALTRLLQQGSEQEALEGVLRAAGLALPTSAELQSLLDSPPEVAEVAWSEQVEPLLGPGVLSLNCRALEDSDWRPQTSEELIEGLFPDRNSPAQKLLAEVVQRVGAHRFSIDFDQPGVAQLEFDDRLDSYRLNPRGRKLRKLSGEPQDVEHLVEQFQLLNRARQEALELFQQALGQQGLYLDGRSDPWWVGAGHRQFSFPVGDDLTRALAAQTPREVVQQWLDGNGLAWGAGLIEKRSLPPGPILFPELDAEWAVLAQGLVDAALQEVLAHPGQALYNQRSACWIWLQPEWRPLLQRFWTQLDESGWLRLARSAWDEQDEAAAQLLLMAGESGPGETILAALEADGWCEAYSRETLWMLAESVDFPLEDDPCPEAPGLWQPPAALARSTARELAFCLEQQHEVLAAAARMPAQSYRDWMTSSELQALRRHIEGLSDFSELWELLRVLGNFEWQDLAARLAENDGFLSALLSDHLGNYGQCALRLRYAGLPELSKQVATLSLVAPPPACDDVEPRHRETVRQALEGCWKFDRLAGALAYLA